MRRFTVRILAVSAVVGWSFACGPAAPGGDVVYHAVKANRILFLGNSITLHGPAPAIGWTGNWGMAASAPEKDYVHLVARAVGEAAGRAPETRAANVAEFERHPSAYDVDTELKKELAFKPDVVVLVIGDNVPPLTTDEARAVFKAGVVKLLKRFRDNGASTVVVRPCFWADPVKDQILEAACRDTRGVFAGGHAFSKDESNLARSERTIAHGGVAGHPGDRGMRAIADNVLEALRRAGR